MNECRQLLSAAVTLVIYDWLLSLSDEVSIFFPAQTTDSVIELFRYVASGKRDGL